MEERTLAERIQKYNKEHLISNGKDDSKSYKLINAREKNLLQLRKNKIEEEIMKSRILSLYKNQGGGDNKYLHLIITNEELEKFLPNYINEEFENYPEKYELINEYLENYIKLDYNNTSDLDKIKIEAWMRFAIMKLRDLSIVFENFNDEGWDIDSKIFENLLKIFFNTNDPKIQFGLTHIFINITYDSRRFTDYLIEEEFLKQLFNLTYSNQPGVISHTIWLFANLIDNDELLNILLQILPNIIERIHSLINEFSNLFIHTDIINNLIWLIYRILLADPDKFDKFVPSIPNLITIFDHELNNRFVFQEAIKNKNFFTEINMEDNSIIKNILLIFHKVTHLTQDDEIYSMFINSSLILNLLKLLNIPPTTNEQIQIILVFRILGELIGSPNSTHTDVILNYNFLNITENILKYYINENYFNVKVLKEIAYSISNIAAGTKEQNDKIFIKSNVPNYILKIAKSFKDPQFIREVIYIFYNAYDYGSDEVKKLILCDDIINLIVSCLRNEINPDVTKLVLDFLKLIFENTKKYLDLDLYKFIKRKFEEKNLTVYLENLQYHANKEISSAADVVLIDNWNCEDQYFLNTYANNY